MSNEDRAWLDTCESIKKVLESRRLAWNDSDSERYARLLTEDCDIVSATGRASHGRQAVIDLYIQQRRLPVYSEAIVTATQIKAIRLLTADVALVDAGYRMTRVHWDNQSAPVDLEGDILFVMQRDTTWKIASIRAQSPKIIPMVNEPQVD
nr:nuclear transport factor 2 family protein [Pseudomonas sp.]